MNKYSIKSQKIKLEKVFPIIKRSLNYTDSWTNVIEGANISLSESSLLLIDSDVDFFVFHILSVSYPLLLV